MIFPTFFEPGKFPARRLSCDNGDLLHGWVLLAGEDRPPLPSLGSLPRRSWGRKSHVTVRSPVVSVVLGCFCYWLEIHLKNRRETRNIPPKNKSWRRASLVEDDFRWVLYVIPAYDLLLYICCIGIWILSWTKKQSVYLHCHVLSCVLVITFVAMLNGSCFKKFGQAVYQIRPQDYQTQKKIKNYWSSIVGWSWLILIWRIDKIYQNLFCQHTSMSE